MANLSRRKCDGLKASVCTYKRLGVILMWAPVFHSHVEVSRAVREKIPHRSALRPSHRQEMYGRWSFPELFKNKNQTLKARTSAIQWKA